MWPLGASGSRSWAVTRGPIWLNREPGRQATAQSAPDQAVRCSGRGGERLGTAYRHLRRMGGSRVTRRLLRYPSDSRADARLLFIDAAEEDHTREGAHACPVSTARWLPSAHWLPVCWQSRSFPPRPVAIEPLDVTPLDLAIFSRSTGVQRCGDSVFALLSWHVAGQA
jgi:hypothetical protein